MKEYRINNKFIIKSKKKNKKNLYKLKNNNKNKINNKIYNENNNKNDVIDVDIIKDNIILDKWIYKIMPNDGYCGYHSIVKYCFYNNIEIFDGNIPLKEDDGNNLIDYLKIKLEMELKKKNHTFDFTNFLLKNMTQKEYIQNLLERLNLPKSNTSSWLDNYIINIISYVTKKSFFIYNDMFKCWTKISNNIEYNEKNSIFLWYNGCTHYNLIYKDKKDSIKKFINDYGDKICKNDILLLS